MGIVVVVGADDVADDPDAGIVGDSGGLRFELDDLADGVGIVLGAGTAHGDFNTFEAEVLGCAGDVGQAVGAHVFAECGVDAEFLAEVLGVGCQSYIAAHHGVLRQGHHEALREVAGVGSLGDDNRRAEGCLGAPFDLAGGGDVLDFGSDGADDVSFGPRGYGFAGVDGADGLLNGVGTLLAAEGECRVADVHDALDVNEGELPGGGGVGGRQVVAEDADNVALLGGELGVPEVGVTRGADCQLGVVLVLDHLVDVLVVFAEDIEAVLRHELNVVDAYELPLHALQIGRIGGVGREVRKVGDGQGVDFLGFGETVHLNVAGEELGSHEGGLIGVVAGRPLGVAHLLETGEPADVETRQVDDKFLADAVVEVEVVGVDRKGERGGSVLDVDRLEDVAGLVGGDHAAADDVVVAVLLRSDLDAEGGIVLPERLFHFENRGVGLERSHGLFPDETGLIVGVLAGGEPGEGSGRQKSVCKILYCFHVNSEIGER